MNRTLDGLVEGQRRFFASGATRSPAWRIGALEKLKAALVTNEDLFLATLKKDLGKPPAEAYAGEIGFVLNEIAYALSRLASWMRPRKARTPIGFFPAVSRVFPEPKGTVLIIGPWNYPLQLVLSPLVGALAAGNCAVLKPSETAPATSRALAGVLGGVFDPSAVAVAEGGPETAATLLEGKFDHIFFTGSARVGRIVMEAAAKNLTPATLELGGKNPCILGRDADVATAARRIAWGKFFNAGQTCVAPDYLLVPPEIKQALIRALRQAVEGFYGPDPRRSPDYARIVNRRHFSRLAGLLGEGDIVIGGETDPSELYIAPTVIDKATWQHRAMEEEIFGPILPVLEYEGLPAAIAEVNARARPLALYFFSKNRKKQREIIRKTSSGGIGINDTILHILSPELPFGGVGQSGMGSYHGKASFDIFTHFKSVMTRHFRPDFRQRYPPYRTPLGLLKKFTRMLR